jgi:hypothetical protein
MKTGDIEPGTVFTFPLPNGLHGACRVVRGPAKDEPHHAGELLIAESRWVGDPKDVLESPDTTKLRKGSTSRTGLYWVKGNPPAKFVVAGVLPPTKAELLKKSQFPGVWDMFPNVAYRDFRLEHEPEVVAKEVEQDRRDSEQEAKETMDRFRATDRFDLAGVIPLGKPRSEREPAEVVRGFIVAMNQWEKESARVARRWGTQVAFASNKEPLGEIMRELCTAKDRPYGRLGNYSDPPEYDPELQEVVGTKLGKTKAEVEVTNRGTYYKTWVFLLRKEDGCWLIESKKADGHGRGL